MRQVAAKVFSGVPVTLTQGTGGGDARRLIRVGIPTYGVSGHFRDPDCNGIHGLNARLRVPSVMEGRDYLYELVKIYAVQAK